MSDVKRWEPENTFLGYNMRPDAEGSFVLHDAYAKLEAEAQALREEVAALRARVVVVPDECPHLIMFDDADVKPIMFAGCGARRAALAKWEQVSINWNAHLFVRIEKNCRDDRYPCATLAAAPAQGGSAHE
ncbi:hypothetical protein [Pseudomonas nicosulfuronedens]